MDAVVAVYSDWGIGDGGTQPVALKADRAHFRSITMNSTVIVGRKTLEDFPGGRPLKGRHNIVVTRQNLTVEGADTAGSTEDALALAAQKPAPCFVIGGASIFLQFFPYTDRVYVTKIGCAPESTRFFPNLDEDAGWTCTYKSKTMTEDGIEYCFCTYERNGVLNI